MSSASGSPQGRVLVEGAAGLKAKEFVAKVESAPGFQVINEARRHFPTANNWEERISTDGPPRDALARFKDLLEGGSSTEKRNFDMNIERVDDFISKPSKEWRITKPEREKPKYALPGIYGDLDCNLPSSRKYVEAKGSTAHDMDPALGPTARFGDGQGTQWDQWILATTQAPPALLKHNYDRLGVPKGDKEPLSGYKRHLQSTRRAMSHPIDYPHRGSTIRTYAERREERLKTEKKLSPEKTMGDASSFLTESASAILQLTPTEENKEDNKEEDETPILNPFECLSKGITPSQEDVYFGEKGRQLFFDMYKKVDFGRHVFYQPSTDSAGFDLRRMIPKGASKQYMANTERELDALQTEVERRKRALALDREPKADEIDASVDSDGGQEGFPGAIAADIDLVDAQTENGADIDANTDSAVDEGGSGEIDALLVETSDVIDSDAGPVAGNDDRGGKELDAIQDDANVLTARVAGTADAARTAETANTVSSITQQRQVLEEEARKRMEEKAIATASEELALNLHLDFLPEKPYDREGDPWVGSEGHKRGHRSRKPRSPKQSPRRAQSWEERKEMEKQEEKRLDFAEKGIVHTVNGREQPIPGQMDLASPRSRFIAGCISEGITPLPEVVVRRDVVPVLNLAHRKLGDAVALHLAQAISGIPFLEELNLADNRLTDVSLPAIINGLPDCKHLRRINLSDNKIDTAAADALHTLLNSPGQVDTLILQRSDVDDQETARWVDAIAAQATVRHLDLTENLIGSHEVRAFQPLALTGGSALAQLLMRKDCSLETLILKWNMIRFKSGENLAASIALNKTLTHLDLSYNSLDETGGEIIGSSLIENSTLRHLNLENNNITARATVTISTALRTWTNRLKTLNLRHNPIGERGARAVMDLQVKLGSSAAKIDIGDCAVKLAAPTCWFDPRSPGGYYDLNLSSPYNRAVAIELLRLSADHDAFNINSCTLKDEGGTEVKIHLEVSSCPSSEAKPSLFEGEVVKSGHRPDALSDAKLDRIRAIASDVDKAAKVFKQFDVDDSGALDKHELRQMLRQLGIGESMTMVRKLLDIYDADGSGTVEEEEFISFLNGIHDGEIKARQYEGQMRFTTIKGSKDRTPFIPPSSGILRCQVECLTVQANFIEAISDERLDSLISLSKNSSDGDAILDFALSTIKLKHEEAMKLFRIMVKQTADPSASLMKILPRMLNTTEARVLFNMACGDDTAVRFAMRTVMGPLLNVIMGRPNGYYTLSLSDEHDKMCLERLVEMSNHLASARQKAGLGDTSQLGDYSSFRNVRLDGAEWYLDCEKFTIQSLPSIGSLEFDFALFPLREESNNKARSLDTTNKEEDMSKGLHEAMSDTRLFNTLCGLGVLESKKKMMTLNNIAFLNKEVETATRLKKVREWQWSQEFASNVAEALDELAEIRQNQLRTKKRISASTGEHDEESEDAIISATGYITEQKFREFETEVLHHLEIRHPVPPRRIARHRRANIDDDHHFATTLNDDDSQAESAQTTLEVLDDFLQRLKLAQEDRTEILHIIVMRKKGKALVVDKKIEWLKKDLQISKHVSHDRRQLSAAQLAAAADAGVVSEEVAEKAAQEEKLKGGPADTEEEHETRPSMGEDKVMDVLHTTRLIHCLLDILGGRGLSCAQLAFVMNRLPQYESTTGPVGTFRVDFVVSLSSQIVDMHNFDLVIKQLGSAREAAMLILRLGWLNIWSPLKPEGSYVLNLSKDDERCIGKQLLLLSVLEKGDTPSTRLPRLREIAYSADPESTFELAESKQEMDVHKEWLTEEGFPSSGVCFLTYHSVLSIAQEERDEDIYLDQRPRLYMMPCVSARAVAFPRFSQFSMKELEEQARKNLTPLVLAATKEEENDGDDDVNADLPPSTLPTETSAVVQAADSDDDSMTSAQIKEQQVKEQDEWTALAETILQIRRRKLELESVEEETADETQAPE